MAHVEDGRAVLDAVRERRPPFSPEAVAGEFAAVLRANRVDRVEGDRFGAEWVAERFRQAGVEYLPSERAKSAIYGELIGPLNSGRPELLDLPRLCARSSSGWIPAWPHLQARSSCPESRWLAHDFELRWCAGGTAE